MTVTVKLVFMFSVVNTVMSDQGATCTSTRVRHMWSLACGQYSIELYKCYTYFKENQFTIR